MTKLREKRDPAQTGVTSIKKGACAPTKLIVEILAAGTYNETDSTLTTSGILSLRTLSTPLDRVI